MPEAAQSHSSSATPALIGCGRSGLPGNSKRLSPRGKIQAWDFLPGGNFVVEMQKATVECERTIAVF